MEDNRCAKPLTCHIIIARLVHLSQEQFEANDRVDDHNEDDEEGDVEQW